MRLGIFRMKRLQTMLKEKKKTKEESHWPQTQNPAREALHFEFSSFPARWVTYMRQTPDYRHTPTPDLCGIRDHRAWHTCMSESTNWATSTAQRKEKCMVFMMSVYICSKKIRAVHSCLPGPASSTRLAPELLGKTALRTFGSGDFPSW